MLKGSKRFRAFIFLITLVTGSLSSPGILLAETPQVEAGIDHTVGLKTDGTVVAVGFCENGQCNVDSWTGIRQVAAGYDHTVGLKADETVVAVGWNNYGQCNVDSWTGIQQVSVRYNHTVGLKADGTVVAVGENEDGQCNVDSWTGIQQVATGDYHTVGLKTDGTVVAVGFCYNGQCNVDSWTGIQQVTAGGEHTVGLKADGTVVAVGLNEDGQCNVDSWTGIQQVTAGYYHTVGLKADGTVVAVGWNVYGQCNVDSWTGIRQVTAGGDHTVGLKTDGTVVAIGYNTSGQCDVDDWNLLSDFPDDPNWVTISGSIAYNGTPLCAMVLANGQYMFSCGENQGVYELEIPLDENGEITLFAFVDGLAPFKVTSEPSSLPSNIEMELASPDSKTPTVTSTVVESIDNPGWVEIAGSVSLEGTPLCAMVLANGQYMFSCDPIGEYQLTVPLDPNGEITLFVFVDGLQPYKEIIRP